MKTQLSILFKNNPIDLAEYLIRRKINVYIDCPQVDKNTPPHYVIKSGRTPSYIELTPGPHRIRFTYNNWREKLSIKLVGAAFGAGFGLAAGDGVGGLIGAEGGSDLLSSLYGMNKTYDNALECCLNDGDTLRIALRAKSNGKVKVKLLDK